MSTRVWLTTSRDSATVTSPDEYRRWAGLRGEARDQHRTGQVVFVADADSPTGEALVIKSHRYPSLRDVRRGLFRTTFGARSRVGREADNLRRLAELDLNPPLVVAWGERRRGGCVVDSFLATRRVPSVDLQQWLPGSSGPERRRCLAAIGRKVAGLHAAGFVHRDLHLRNLLRTPKGRLVTIDCSRGCFVPALLHPHLALRDLRDLAGDLALHAPADRDRLRVLRAYRSGFEPTARAKSAVRRAIGSCPAGRSRGLR